MERFDRQAFNRFILDHKVVGFFEKPVTLKSGRQSNWYVNWRTVSGDVFLLDAVADHLIAFVKQQGWAPDAFYGVPEGASKLGVIATYKWALAQGSLKPGSHCLPMGRGKPKEHGAAQDRFFLTPPRGRIVVVEDVTTTGGSLIAALKQLKEIDVEVIAAVGLTNRMELRDDGRSVAEAVAEFGAPYLALSDATAFLPEAYARLKPGEAIGRAIEEEFARYGVAPLSLT